MLHVKFTQLKKSKEGKHQEIGGGSREGEIKQEAQWGQIMTSQDIKVPIFTRNGKAFSLLSELFLSCQKYFWK